MSDSRGKVVHIGSMLDPDAMGHGEEQDYTCEHHGGYRGRPFTLTGRTWIAPTCPACEEERKAREAEEEASRREQAAERRIVAAGIPERFRGATLDGYRADTQGQKFAKAAISRYVDRFDERRKVGGCLMLIGKTGTGKTHLACAMVSELMGAGWKAMYSDTMGLMQRVKATYGRDSHETEEQAIAQFVRPDLLVIDEIGVQYGTDTERAIMHHILDRRYLAMRPTVVVGNVDLAGLKLYLGERAVSRLHEAGGMLLPCDWDDHRMKKS